MNNGFRLALFASVALVGGLVLLLRGGDVGRSSESLTIYYASGVRRPVEEIIAAYGREYSVEIQTQSAGSGELVGSIKASGRGDLFLAADVSYLQRLQAAADNERQFVDQILPVAYQRPVVAVRRGNPMQIGGLDDLMQRDVKVSLADPDVAAIGHVVRERLDADDWNAVWEHKAVARANVNMVANDVVVGAAHAGIVWDATASQYSQLETIELTEFADDENRIAIGVLTTSENPDLALHFARFLAAGNRGLARFREHGYRTVDGEPWPDAPGGTTP